MKRWGVLLVAVVCAAGCRTGDPGAIRQGTGGEPASAPAFLFPPHEPLLPAAGPEGALPLAPVVAPDPADGVGMSGVAPLVRPAAGRPLLRPVEQRASIEELLAEKTRQLHAYLGRELDTLNEFVRLKFMQLQKETLLLLLYTERFDGEECKKVMEVLAKLPLRDMECAGLQFVLFSRLGERRLRDESFAYIERMLQGRPEFRVDNLCFCEKVLGLGRVKKIENPIFARGGWITVYGECRGATVRTLPQGGAQLEIEAYLRVLDMEDRVVDIAQIVGGAQGIQTLEAGADPAAPTFFYGQYRVSSRIKPGSYKLQVSVKDVVGRTELTLAPLFFQVAE